MLCYCTVTPACRMNAYLISREKGDKGAREEWRKDGRSGREEGWEGRRERGREGNIQIVVLVEGHN